MADVVRDTLEIVAWRLKAADATVQVDLGPTPPVVARRLQSAAAGAGQSDLQRGRRGRGPRRSRASSVSARRKAGKVTISVRDHGPGVPAAIAERIFDPFFTTKGVGKGLGLGLSISYNIVKDFGGSLAVSNDPEGGAVFTIELDAVRAPLREAAE